MPVRKASASPRRGFATPRETREQWQFPAMRPQELRSATARPVPRTEWVGMLEQQASKALAEAGAASVNTITAGGEPRRRNSNATAPDATAQSSFVPVPPSLQLNGPSTARRPASTRARHPRMPRDDMPWSPNTARKKRLAPHEIAALFVDQGDSDQSVFRPTADSDTVNARAVVEDVDALEAALSDEAVRECGATAGSSRRSSLQQGSSSVMTASVRRRRASSIGGADGRGARGVVVSPTRRNGRIVFIEGATAYLVDFQGELILPFEPAEAPKEVVVAPGTAVSFRRRIDRGRETVTAVALGVQARRLSSQLSGSSSAEVSDFPTGSPQARTPTKATTPRSRNGGRSPTRPFSASPPPALVPFQNQRQLSSSGLLGASEPTSPAAAGEDDTFGIPANGWEYYRLLQKQKGDDRIMTATPNTLVRMVDASCRFDEEEAEKRREEVRRFAEKRADKATEIDRLPKEGPAVAVAAAKWSRGKHPATVIHAVHRCLTEVPAAREDGELLVFDELPTRLSDATIEDWNTDPMDAKREKLGDRLSTAKHAYAQWYLKPEGLSEAYAREKEVRDAAIAKREQSKATSRRKAGAAAADRLRTSPPLVRAAAAGVTRPECDLEISSRRASACCSSRTSSASSSLSTRAPSSVSSSAKALRGAESLPVVPGGGKRTDDPKTQEAVEAASRGTLVGETVLTRHIERVQAGDPTAVGHMVQSGLKVRRDEAKAKKQRQMNSKLAAEYAARQQQQQGHPQAAEPHQSGGPTARSGSPARERATPSTKPLAGSPAGGAEQPPAAPGGTGGRYRLPKNAYHGRLWAMSQGDALSGRSMPDEQEAAKANAAFLQLMHKHRHHQPHYHQPGSGYAPSAASPTAPSLQL